MNDNMNLVNEILELKRTIRELTKENKSLKQQLSNMSWKTNPDRMGGGYTIDEIVASTEWR